MDELSRFRLDGQVALVAGGSGGIGLRISQALAGVGARVAIVGQSTQRLEAAHAAVEKAGSSALALALDMTKKADADRAVEKTLRGVGRGGGGGEAGGG